MYFVNKEQLSRKLTYLKQLTDDYAHVKDNHYAFERVAQMLIESSVDIGNMIIDAFILRDPGNYKDVIDILELEVRFQKILNCNFTEQSMCENNSFIYMMSFT